MDQTSEKVRSFFLTTVDAGLSEALKKHNASLLSITGTVHCQSSHTYIDFIGYTNGNFVLNVMMLVFDGKRAFYTELKKGKSQIRK